MYCRKPSDVIEPMYNRVNPVLDENIFKVYYHYMTERHLIYKRKESGESKPWTDDPILQNNSFTCCKRYLDKTSKYLIEKISHNPRLSYEDKIWKTILFRLYNKIETIDLINISSYNFWNTKVRLLNMDKIDEMDCDPFSRAYKIIAPKYAYRDISVKGHDCWKSSLLFWIGWLHDQYHGHIPAEITRSPYSCVEWLKENIKGVGDFIAYQIWVDFTYIPEYPFSDNHFVMAGPGCIAGIDMLCTDRDGLTHEEFLVWLRDNIENLFRQYDPSYRSLDLFDDLPMSQRFWSLQDLENSFCELSKYIYISEGRHKRPRKYSGIPTE